MYHHSVTSIILGSLVNHEEVFQFFLSKLTAFKFLNFRVYIALYTDRKDLKNFFKLGS